jgi:hypothetical protein
MLDRGKSVLIKHKRGLLCTNNQTTTPVQNNTKNFSLNIQKSLGKESAACERSDIVKITQTGGGTRMWLQTGTYELFKYAISTT